MEIRQMKEEEKYMNEFRKNVIKRDQMEKRRKAKEEERYELIAYNMEQLRDKKDAAQRRIEESNRKKM